MWLEKRSARAIDFARHEIDIWLRYSRLTT